MSSQAFQTFGHAIQDSIDLLNHFDKLNTNPPSPNIEVLKRASLVMALAALETYFEDRINEAIESFCVKSKADDVLLKFYRHSLETDLKSFNSPTTERVKQIFLKYLAVDVTEAWSWNNCEPDKAKIELTNLVKKRGEIAHRSMRPTLSEAQPKQHAVTRDDLRKHIHFIKQIATTTDAFLDEKT